MHLFFPIADYNRPEAQEGQYVKTLDCLRGARPDDAGEHLAINLGAPGDMRDDEGTLWFGYPRPRAVSIGSNTGYGNYAVMFDIKDKIADGMGYFCKDHRSVSVNGSSRPWLFTSGCLGFSGCRIRLIDDMWGESPGTYMLRLGFIAPVGDREGQRVFDIVVQDQVVEEDFDIVRVAGGADRAIVREYKNIRVGSALSLELASKMSNPSFAQVPLINFIQVVREDESEGVKAGTVTKNLSDTEAALALTRAADAMSRDDHKEALSLYHQVFDAAPSKEIKCRALEGMAAIASPESLERITYYCRDVDPILREYQDLDRNMCVSAAKLFCTVATRMQASNRDRADRMFDQVLVLMSTPEMFDEIMDISPTFPPTVRAKVKREAARIIRERLAGTRGIEKRQKLVEQLESIGVAAGAQAAAQGFVTKWRMLGLFPAADEGKGMIVMGEKEYIFESAPDIAATYQVGDEVLRWQEYTSDSPRIDMLFLYGLVTWVTAYAEADIFLPEDQDVLLKIRSFDGFKCWFNGEQVGAVYQRRPYPNEDDVLTVKGMKGRNTVLVKLMQGTGAWQFALRVLDAKGRPIPKIQP